jgi:hypothetical protein
MLFLNEIFKIIAVEVLFPIRGKYFDDRRRRSSASIVSGYGLDNQVIEVQFPVERKEFFL